MPDRYFIKDGYVPQIAAHTLEAAPGAYWQPWRVQQASKFQFDVYQRARNMLDTTGVRSVADVGCGTGWKLNHFFGGFHAVAFDQPTLAEVVHQHAPRAEFRPIDLACPGTSDESFDLVICADVIEHLLDPDPCMAFLRSLTGRFCFLSTPERDIVRGADCMESVKDVHVREWNAAEFARYVSSRGFEILRHELLPPARLDDAEHALRAQSPLRTRAWHGCQLVVCRPAM